MIYLYECRKCEERWELDCVSRSDYLQKREGLECPYCGSIDVFHNLQDHQGIGFSVAGITYDRQAQAEFNRRDREKADADDRRKVKRRTQFQGGLKK